MALPSFRRRFGAVLAATAIGLSLGAIYHNKSSGGGGGGGSQTANIWMDPAGAVSCTRVSPAVTFAAATGHICKTASAAYQAAANGDTILMNAGTYNANSEPIIGANAGVVATGTPVVMKPANSAAVVWDLGSVYKGSANDFMGVTGLTIDGSSGSLWLKNGSFGIIPANGSGCGGNMSHVIFENLRINGSFTLNSATFITFLNDDIGDFSYADGAGGATGTDGPGGAQNNWGDSSRIQSYTSCGLPDHIVLNNVHFHDIYRGDSGSHIECLFVHESTNVLIENSFFDHCPTYGVLLQGDAAFGEQSFSFINNLATTPCPDYTQAAAAGVPIGPGPLSGDCGAVVVNEAQINNGNVLLQNMTIAFNTLLPDSLGNYPHLFLAAMPAADYNSTDQFIGNLLGDVSPSCSGGTPGSNLANATFAYNVWASGLGTCAATDSTSTSAANIDGSGRLIPGAPAIDFVPSSTCTPITTTDRKGNTRPQGAACDAGSDEK